MSALTEVTSNKNFGGFQKVFNHKRYVFILLTYILKHVNCPTGTTENNLPIFPYYILLPLVSTSDTVDLVNKIFTKVKSDLVRLIFFILSCKNTFSGHTCPVSFLLES